MQRHASVPGAPRRLIRLPQVKTMTGIGKSTIYDLMRTGRFPASVKLGRRAIAWVEEEVHQWIDSTIASARAPNLHSENRSV